MSAGPPAAHGTMIVAVLAGYSWACALFIPATIRRTAVIIECFATYRLPDIVIVVTICWFFRTSRVGVVAVWTGGACQDWSCHRSQAFLTAKSKPRAVAQ